MTLAEWLDETGNICERKDDDTVHIASTYDHRVSHLDDYYATALGFGILLQKRMYDRGIQRDLDECEPEGWGFID